MNIEAKTRLQGTEISAHLRELDGVLDKQTIGRLLKLESYGDFSKVEFDPKYVTLTLTPHVKARATKQPALDINGLAAMVQALHGLIAEITPAQGTFKISIKV